MHAYRVPQVPQGWKRKHGRRAWLVQQSASIAASLVHLQRQPLAEGNHPPAQARGGGGGGAGMGVHTSRPAQQACHVEALQFNTTHALIPWLHTLIALECP